MDAITENVHEQPLVLVIDDDPHVRTLTKRLLERSGKRVLLAENGNQGLELFEQNMDEIKLVVLDWHLPGNLGTRTFDELYARRSDLRVVLITGDHDAELGTAARENLACLLLKPFNAAEFMLAVDTLLTA